MKMKWKKLGHIYPQGNLPAGFVSHAAVPVVRQIDTHIIRIYFSARDKQAHSHVLFTDLDIRNPEKMLGFSSRPVLSPGDLGCFDDSGVMGTSILEKDNEIYLYYVGWNLGVTVPFRNAVGLAIWDKKQGKFKRCYPGPILDRTKDEPHFTASCHVMKDYSKLRMWYVSCVNWTMVDDRPFHRYHIKYAQSQDGIVWERDGVVALDFCDRHEYALSVPRVIKENNRYRMWFSCRARKEIKTYRIQCAESTDGVRFIRTHENPGIDVSKTGWDSEMICYPFVFDMNYERYMLYNGNGYGKTGFGLAVMVDDSK